MCPKADILALELSQPLSCSLFVWPRVAVQTSVEEHARARASGVNAIPVRDYERVVDDVECIRATIERFQGGRWRSTTCRSGGEDPARPAGAATPATTQRKFTG